MGEIVPADAKVLSGALSVDQSALTGESLPVEVGPSDILYSSSVVKRGEAQCLVVNTGSNYLLRQDRGTRADRATEIPPGRDHALRCEVHDLPRNRSACGGCRGRPADEDRSSDGRYLCCDLPHGRRAGALPAVLTIVQAVGAMELVRKGVLVTRLDSMEDAASLDVLCLDKTGTLTMNQLSVTEVIPYAGHQVNDVLATAALTAQPESKDGIDIAVRESAGQQASISRGTARFQSRRSSRPPSAPKPLSRRAMTASAP